MKYFIDQDNDGHWYVIPLDLREIWIQWNNLDSDDEESWEPPKGVYSIGGDPGMIIFENWTHEE